MKTIGYIIIIFTTLATLLAAATAKTEKEFQPFEEIAEGLAKRYNIHKDYKDLRKRLRKCSRKDGIDILDAVSSVQKKPFMLEKTANELLEHAEHGLQGASSMLKIKSALPDLPERPGADARPKKHFEWMESMLVLAAECVDNAFSAFDEKERSGVRKNLISLGEVFEENKYVHTDKNKERWAGHKELLKQAKKVDYEILFRAALIMQKIYDREYMKILKSVIEKTNWNLNRQWLSRRKTPVGEIVIGGKCSNRYNKDAAIIIDLGGDDLYYNNAGASRPGIPCALLVDFAGDDAYQATENYAQGTGVMGVGMLLDFSGDDSYVGLRWCQGSGCMGVGSLVDSEGNDVYRAHAYAQGVGLWGAGLCVDEAGADRYESHSLSQGVGMTCGVGMLRDETGDDLYYSGGTYRSSYGTRGIFTAWSQGVGLGFRLYAAGGMGLLVDKSGRDRYEAGIFAQGGGYYYGIGIQWDDGNESDEYVGSRYAQGWSAHQAVGVFIENGGDDVYQTRNAVHAGLAWDQCVTLFMDLGGNDRYLGSGFSQGASAHNSICVFYDASGDDLYACSESPGRSNPNDYHGGTSLSLFIDLGGGKDEYKKDSNSSIKMREQHGLFLDLDEKTLAHVKKIIDKPAGKE